MEAMLQNKTTAEMAELFALLSAHQNAPEIKANAKEQAEEAKAKAKEQAKKILIQRAEAELKGMKAPEIKARAVALLVAEYTRQEKASVKNGTAKKAKAGGAKPSAETCGACVCEQNPNAPHAHTGQAGKWNALRPCGKGAKEGGLCAKHAKEKGGSKWGECRNGEFGKPHSFGEILYGATPRNKDKEWALHMWETYPEMKPAEEPPAEETAEEEID